jgi:hypothetical protein
MPWTATITYPSGLTASAKVFASRTEAITIRENSQSPMWGKPNGRTSETGREPSKRHAKISSVFDH